MKIRWFINDYKLIQKNEFKITLKQWEENQELRKSIQDIDDFFLLDISEKSDTTNEGLNVQMKNRMENLNLDRICNLEDKSLEIAQ